MVQASEIRDRETLEAWLNARPEAVRQRDAVIMAHRAALRVLPLYLGNLDHTWARKNDLTALPLLRVSLTSGAGAHAWNPAPEVKEAARAAFAAAVPRAAASLAIGAADAAARGEADALNATFAVADALAAAVPRAAASLATDAADAAARGEADAATRDAAWRTARVALDVDARAAVRAAALAAAWRTARADAEILEAGELLAAAPLRAEGALRWFLEERVKARHWLISNPGHDFWIRWYEAALAGQPLTGDWDSHGRLLTEIALIPDADWEKGAEHVALLIEKIEEGYRRSEAEPSPEVEAALLAEALPMAETIEINPETGSFHAVPIALQNAPLVGQVLARVQDALNDALQGNNGLNEHSREARVIPRVVTRFGNDPQRIEMDFTSIAVGLRRQFEVEDLPRTEDNLALCDAVEEGVRAIRATHPEVAENRRILAGQAMAEMSREERALLAEATPLLAAISDADLAQDFAEDSAEILAPRLPGVSRSEAGGAAPVLQGVTEAERLFSRVAKIALSKQLGDAVLKVDGSATYKGARIIATIHSLVSLGIKLFGVIRPFL